MPQHSAIALGAIRCAIAPYAGLWYNGVLRVSLSKATPFLTQLDFDTFKIFVGLVTTTIGKIMIEFFDRVLEKGGLPGLITVMLLIIAILALLKM